MVTKIKRKAKKTSRARKPKRAAKRRRKPGPRVPAGTRMVLKLATKKRLPKSLSGWIVSAVKDARRLAKKPGFELDMLVYNEFYPGVGGKDVCHICLGGAAIVGAGLVKPGEDTNGWGTTTLARALDNVRTGSLLDAAEDLYGYAVVHAFPADVLQRLVSIGVKLYGKYNSGRHGHAAWPAYLSAARQLAQMGL